MPNLFELKGAHSAKPTRYAPMFTNRWFQGLWTQRNPFRDAGSTRIEEAFYGSRGDGLIDGQNVEISNRLTLVRRPGSSVYNSRVFDPITRYYSNRISVYNPAHTVLSEKIQVVADTASGIWDATGPNTKDTIYGKSSGAGSTFFQSVGNTLYFSNGDGPRQYISPSYVWTASTKFDPGALISPTGVGGAMYMALGGITLKVLASACSGAKFVLWFDPLSLPAQFPNLQGAQVTFSGLTTATALNGNTYAVSIFSTTEGVLSVAQAGGSYNKTADTGSATTGSGTTGGTSPSFNPSIFAVTPDAGQQWKSYATAVGPWGLATPTTAPTAAPAIVNGGRWWQPNTVLPTWYAILDTSQNVQAISNTAKTGYSYPVWAPQPVSTIAQTTDGGATWNNWGPVGTWAPSTAFGGTLGQNVFVILDPNGNWQLVTSGGGGNSGGSAPAWATAVGTTTSDGALTWTCLGPGAVMTTASVTYAFSTHAIDGSVSTASPIITINGPIVGPPLLGSTSLTELIQSYLTLTGVFSGDVLMDQIWIWRSVQGGSTSTLLLEDQIPIDLFWASGTFSYNEIGIPDPALDNLILAPIAGTNNPPPKGLTALTYHLGCVWGAIGNILYRSRGPDATTGNGSTAWSASDYWIYPSTIIRLYPSTLGLVVFTTSQPFILSGTNTSGSPLISFPYLWDLGLLSYDAFDVNGALPNLLTSDLQMVAFDPSSGVNEVGFPIQDQFQKTTTAGLNASLFNSSSSYVAWHVYGPDKGLFVSDGSTGWFRLSPTPAPETGMTWSPFAEIVGGCSAVQSIEVSPGVHNLLIGPKTSGPILKRDTSVFSDNGSAYNAYATLGSIVPAQPGQFAALEFVTTDSIKIGTPLTLAIQLDEIGYPAAGLFETLSAYVHDPTELPNNVTLNQQRFYISQTQKPAICRSFQIQINFGSDTVQNELLNLSVFGGFAQEK